MPKKTAPATPAVTAATMPDSYTVPSVVFIPTLKERVKKAHTFGTQALRLFALAQLINPDGRADRRGQIDERLKPFYGLLYDPFESMEAAWIALRECLEELYVIMNHPDQDALEAMRVPTEEDWEFYQKTTETGGAE